MKPTVIKAVLFASALVSCSIKEDREPCPCVLEIDFSECPLYKEAMTLQGWREEASCFSESIVPGELERGVFKSKIEKGTLEYNACSPLEESFLDGCCVIIPAGHQSDPLFACSATVKALGETASDTVRLHKQFADMTVSFGKQNGVESDIVSITVTATSKGIDLRSLTPVEGKFRCNSSAENGFFKVRLPRLSDGRIVIDTYTVDGFLKRFELGEPVKSSGFDWEAEDLDDLWIDYDFGRSEITVEIVSWSEGYDITEII